MTKSKLKKGDRVLIRKGKDRGKVGQISQVLASQEKLVLTGINILKKHAKPSKKYPKGGIIDIEQAIPWAKASLICPHCQKITRLAGQNKKRLCRLCQKDVDSEVKEVKYEN